jgi:carboxypeptidase Taq
MIEKSYAGYVERMRQLADLSNAASLLHWDQEVYLPINGNTSRAGQLATLSGIIYNLQTEPEFVALLNELSINPNLEPEQKKNVELSLKEINRKLLLDRKFVERLTLTSSNAYRAWVTARKENKFSLFAPWLEKIVKLKQEECQKIGFSEHPYDVLIDEYEPGMKTRQLDHLFSSLKPELEKLIQEIRNSPNTSPDTAFAKQFYPAGEQWKVGMDVIGLMGFDFESGRQDISEHPFTISLGLRDVRITTRIDEHNLFEMLWSCIHEGGHGLYEQGFDVADYGLPKAEAASLGIHESQSRLWENHVGRGVAFWNFYFNKLKMAFPAQLESVNENTFYAAMNVIKPSLIRTNADELTYHFHVIIRFELEKGLIDGTLTVADLPARWNELYKKYLQLNVPDDNSGILQDIHWSHGSFGYFPTYSLGSLYAAQFFHQVNIDIPDLQQEIATGNLKSLNAWLQHKVYSKGKHVDSNELCKMITGESININYFIDYASQKYRQLYLSSH